MAESQCACVNVFFLISCFFLFTFCCILLSKICLFTFYFTNVTVVLRRFHYIQGLFYQGLRDWEKMPSIVSSSIMSKSKCVLSEKILNHSYKFKSITFCLSGLIVLNISSSNIRSIKNCQPTYKEILLCLIMNIVTEVCINNFNYNYIHLYKSLFTTENFMQCNILFKIAIFYHVYVNFVTTIWLIYCLMNNVSNGFLYDTTDNFTIHFFVAPARIALDIPTLNLTFVTHMNCILHIIPTYTHTAIIEITILKIDVYVSFSLLKSYIVIVLRMLLPYISCKPTLDCTYEVLNLNVLLSNLFYMILTLWVNQNTLDCAYKVLNLNVILSNLFHMILTLWVKQTTYCITLIIVITRLYVLYVKFNSTGYLKYVVVITSLIISLIYPNILYSIFEHFATCYNFCMVFCLGLTVSLLQVSLIKNVPFLL